MTFGSVVFAAVLSSLLMAVPAVQAHEVYPSILNMRSSDEMLTLTFDLNLEAMMAGVDLDGLADTDADEQAADYDTLRALEVAEIGPLFLDFLPELTENITLLIDGERVPLQFTARVIPDVGNAELPRQSTVIFHAPLLPNAERAQVGWVRPYGILIVRQNTQAPDPFTATLQGGEMTEPFLLAGGTVRSGWATFAEYIPVGFDHILPKGLDHILFVLGLFFLSTRLGPLLWQISAFTLAHTVTLALGALGWVNVPAGIVEPLIAASITYVAVENVLSSKLHRWRPVVVFCFGLLHGLGFASVLGEFGLPAGQFLPALIGFNIGVELGQIAVIAIAFVTVSLWFRHRDWYRQWIAVPASLVIACVGAWWFVERAFLG